MSSVRYLKTPVDGTNIFYREAGSRDAPKLLLLLASLPRATCFAT